MIVMKRHNCFEKNRKLPAVGRKNRNGQMFRKQEGCYEADIFRRGTYRNGVLLSA